MYWPQPDIGGYGAGDELWWLVIPFVQFFSVFPHLTTVILLLGFICLVISLGLIAWTILGLIVVQPALFLSKRRHLFWRIPLFLVLLCLVLQFNGVEVVIDVQDNPFPGWAKPAFYWTFHVCLFGSALSGGVIAPAIVVPLHSLFKRLFYTDQAEEHGFEQDHIKPASTAIIPGFFEGLLTPWRGFKYMTGHVWLFRYAFFPFLLNIFITIGVLILLVPAGQKLLSVLQRAWETGPGWFLMNLLIGIVVTMVVLAGVVVGWILLQGILCDHFYGLLAEQVERQLGLSESEIEEVSLKYQVYDGVMDSGWLLCINAGCLLVQLIPGIGTILGVCGGIYNNCMTLGTDQLSHALALRGVRRFEQYEFARKHWPQTFGLGVSVSFMALIPILGSMLLTTAAAGGVLLHRRLKALDD